jgi:hypothetical protein
MFQPMFIISIGEILARVRSAAFGSVQRRSHYCFSEGEHVLEFKSVNQISVKAIAQVVDRYITGPLFQVSDSIKRSFQTLFVPKNRAIGHHDFLERLPDAPMPFTVPVFLNLFYPVHCVPLGCSTRLHPG